MPTQRQFEIVTFNGGEHDGLAVRVPTDVAARLPRMTFQVLAGGGLFDVDAGVRIPGAKVVPPPTRPAAQSAPAPAPAPAPPPLAARQEPAPPRRPAPGLPLFRPARPARDGVSEQ